MGGQMNNAMANPMMNPMMGMDPMMMMQMAGMGMMDPMMMMQMAGMGMMGNQQQFHQNPQSNNRLYTGGTMSFDANNKKRQVKPVHGNDDGHKDDVGYQNNKD